jgi:hypothetical protein
MGKTVEVSENVGPGARPSVPTVLHVLYGESKDTEEDSVANEESGSPV